MYVFLKLYAPLYARGWSARQEQFGRQLANGTDEILQLIEEAQGQWNWID